MRRLLYQLQMQVIQYNICVDETARLEEGFGLAMREDDGYMDGVEGIAVQERNSGCSGR